jgi:transcriptional regulator with XRE-family HTH domain
MPPEIKPKTPLALEILTRMKEKGFSVHQLADETDVVYETIRGIVAGDRPPGKRLCRAICDVLRLDFATVNEMLTAEQMKRKFGRVPARTTGIDQRLQLIEDLWPLLLAEEKERITWFVERLADKRGRKREPSPPQRIAPRPVRTP